jgi:hypothetical protein
MSSGLHRKPNSCVTWNPRGLHPSAATLATRDDSKCQILEHFRVAERKLAISGCTK